MESASYIKSVSVCACIFVCVCVHTCVCVCLCVFVHVSRLSEVNRLPVGKWYCVMFESLLQNKTATEVQVNPSIN